MKKFVLAFLLIALLLMSKSVLAEETSLTEYTLGAGDMVTINILKPEELVTKVTISPDGFLACPYIGQVPAKGRTLTVIQRDIQNQLADGYLKYPVVLVTLDESRSRKFYVYGEVAKPGEYVLDENTTVLKAISKAGGFSKFASASNLKIMREKKQGTGFENIKINTKAVMEGVAEEDVVLQNGDILVVSEGAF